MSHVQHKELQRPYFSVHRITEGQLVLSAVWNRRSTCAAIVLCLRQLWTSAEQRSLMTLEETIYVYGIYVMYASVYSRFMLCYRCFIIIMTHISERYTCMLQIKRPAAISDEVFICVAARMPDAGNFITSAGRNRKTAADSRTEEFACAQTLVTVFMCATCRASTFAGCMQRWARNSNRCILRGMGRVLTSLCDAASVLLPL